MDSQGDDVLSVKNAIAYHLENGSIVEVLKSCMDHHRKQRTSQSGSGLPLDPREKWNRFIESLIDAWIAADVVVSQSIINGLVGVPGDWVQTEDIELLATLIARLEKEGFDGASLILVRMLNEMEKPRELISAIIKARCRSSVLLKTCFDVGLATIKVEDISSNTQSLGFISRLARELGKDPREVTERTLKIFDVIDDLCVSQSLPSLMELLMTVAMSLFEYGKGDAHPFLMRYDISKVADRLIKKDKSLGERGNVFLIVLLRQQLAVCDAICSVLESLSENEVPPALAERIIYRLGSLKGPRLPVQVLLVQSFVIGFILHLGDNESAISLLEQLGRMARNMENEIPWPEFQTVVPTALALIKSNDANKAEQLVKKYYPVCLKQWWRRYLELRFTRTEMVYALTYAAKVNAQLHKYPEVERLLGYALAKTKKLSGGYAESDIEDIVQTLIEIGPSEHLLDIYHRLLRATARMGKVKAWAIVATLSMLTNPFDEDLLQSLRAKVVSLENDTLKREVVESLVQILMKNPCPERADYVIEILETTIRGIEATDEKQKALSILLPYICAVDKKPDFRRIRTMSIPRQLPGNKLGFPLTISSIARAACQAGRVQDAKLLWDQVWTFADNAENEKRIKASVCQDMATVMPEDALELARRITDPAYRILALSSIGQVFIKQNDMPRTKMTLEGISECLDNTRTENRTILMEVCKLLLSTPATLGPEPLIRKYLEHLSDKPLQLKAILDSIVATANDLDQLSCFREIVGSIKPSGDKWNRAKFSCIVAEFLAETGEKDQSLAYIKSAGSEAETEEDLDFLTPHLSLIARLEIAVQAIKLGEESKSDLEEILPKMDVMEDGRLVPWKAELSARVGYLLHHIGASSSGDEWFRKAVDIVENPAWKSDRRYEQARKVCIELVRTGKTGSAIDLARHIQNLTERDLLLESISDAIPAEGVESLEAMIELATSNTTRVKIMEVLASATSIREESRSKNLVLRNLDCLPALDMALRAWSSSQKEFPGEVMDLAFCLDLEKEAVTPLVQ